MKLDSAIRTFTESYDQEAINSIDVISQDVGLNSNKMSLKLFNLRESCQHFNDWLKGYASYKVNWNGKPEASSQEVIKESASKMLESPEMFKETAVRYKDIPDFVRGYVEEVQSLLETVDLVKSTMTEGDIDPEAIGDVNEFCDHFMDKLDKSFSESMEKILWASGYKSRQCLFGRKPAKKAEKPVFI